MFDLGWAELLLVAVVALVVIGPKDLPQAMRLVRQWLRKARSLTREFQSGIDDLAKQADLDDVKAEIKAMAEYNPEGELRESLDPGGEITGSLPTGADIDDDSESNTEDVESIMDIHDALEEDDTDGDTEPDATEGGQSGAAEDRSPDVAAAESTDGEAVADAQQSMTVASVDRAAEDSKSAEDDAPLGTVMGPVPVEAKAKTVKAKEKEKEKEKVSARRA